MKYGSEDVLEDLDKLDDDWEEDEDFILELGHKAAASIKLQVLPASVDTVTTLSVTAKRKRLALDFGPHGTVFKHDALLTITAVGLKLKGINPEGINVFYYNSESGAWEQVNCDNVIVHEKRGFVRVTNARIPHFSRYALAWSE